MSGSSSHERCRKKEKGKERAGKWMEKLMLRSYVVSRISLTRPQLAAQVETLLVNMGQQGQIRGQVSDEALKGLLEQVRGLFYLSCLWD